MSRRSSFVASLALVWPLCLAGCGSGASSHTGDTVAVDERRGAPAAVSPVAAAPAAESLSVAPPLPTEPAADWKVYRGDGFELRYPPDATVGPDTSFPAGLPGVAIRGRTISLRSRNPDIGTHTGPAYALVISSFSNRAGRSLEAWVDSVRDARNAHEMDPDSLGFVRPPTSVTVAGAPALTLSPFCGDCQPEEVYVAGPGHVLVASKLYDLSIPGDERAQWRLYDAILSTLRWTE